ncbi:Uncharacterised protein [Mycobacterium tuberculosis]|nr:Uncharacterised protein [Mycobacterium tuberculosis]
MVIVLLSFYAMFGAGSRGCAGVYMLLCAGASSLYVIFYLKALWGWRLTGGAVRCVMWGGCAAVARLLLGQGGVRAASWCGVPFRS